MEHLPHLVFSFSDTKCRVPPILSFTEVPCIKWIVCSCVRRLWRCWQLRAQQLLLTVVAARSTTQTKKKRTLSLHQQLHHELHKPSAKQQKRWSEYHLVQYVMLLSKFYQIFGFTSVRFVKGGRTNNLSHSFLFLLYLYLLHPFLPYHFPIWLLALTIAPLPLP